MSEHANRSQMTYLRHIVTFGNRLEDLIHLAWQLRGVILLGGEESAELSGDTVSAIKCWINLLGWSANVSI